MLTYRRPDELRRALEAVTRQLAAVASDPTLGVAGDLLVVDNDPHASARERVEAHGVARYHHEPRPGIAAARNAALAAAADSDLLVFIDDDEVPEPDWLAALLRVWRRTGAAAVVGRIVCRYAVEPDRWVRGSDFFRRRHRPTGTSMSVAATNNLLLDLRAVRALDLWFDPTLGRAGGEDTLFSRMLVRCGEQIVWCDEAVVIDVVPAERVTRRFVRYRTWAHGCTSIRVDLRVARDPMERGRVRLRAVVGGCSRVVGGSLRWMYGLVSSDVTRQARAARTVLRGAGMLTAVVGLVVVEYADGGPHVRRDRLPHPQRTYSRRWRAVRSEEPAASATEATARR